MPDGVMYAQGKQIQTIYFANPKAMLPIKLSNGEITFLPWGRRQAQAGILPLGGWARLQAIYKGRWDSYMPKPVRLPILKFMQTDFEGNTHWYDVTEGHWLQGLVARENNETRVYIVTIVPELVSALHERWPRIIVSS